MLQRRKEFSLKRRRRGEISLTKIIIVLSALFFVAVGVLKFSRWFTEDVIGGKVESTALVDMDRARQLFEEGDTVEARELLRPITARVQNPAILTDAYLLLAEMDHAKGDVDAAMENLETAYSFRNSPEHPRAAAAYAQLLEDEGDVQAAVSIYREIVDTAPPKLQGAALNGLAREAKRDGDLIRARTLYKQALAQSEWESEPWDEAIDALGSMNIAMIFGVTPTPESKTYSVESGDTLTDIGIKLNTTMGLLMRANDITDPGKLSLGQKLKYTPKDFRIVIERSSCTLYLVDNDGVFKRYPVGLGRKGRETTEGRFKIGNKQKNPTWYKPGGGVVAPLAPENELGTRWMPLVPDSEGLPTDLGIHGTNDPSSIGKYSSSGCPRMHKEDVEELYDLVVRSTPVLIVEEYEGPGGETRGDMKIASSQ